MTYQVDLDELSAFLSSVSVVDIGRRAAQFRYIGSCRSVSGEPIRLVIRLSTLDLFSIYRVRYDDQQNILRYRYTLTQTALAEYGED